MLNKNELLGKLFSVTLGAMVVVALIASAVQAETIVIDDFSAPDQGGQIYSFDFVMPTPGSSASPFTPKAHMEILDVQAPEIWGGERDLTADVVGDVQWNSASGEVGNGLGVLRLSTLGTESGTTVELVYPGPSNVDLTDGGANLALALDFNFMVAGDLDLNLKIAATGPNGTATFDSAASILGDVTESDDPFVYAAPFAEFDNEGALATATSLTITFNGLDIPVSNVNFELTEVSAVVPEPSTLVSLSILGIVLGLGAWRRRK